MRKEISSLNGVTFSVKLPRPQPDLSAGYLFSFHKAGSTLMDSMIRSYCDLLGFPTFSLFNSAFDAGVPTREIGPEAKDCFEKSGVIYTGFRHYPTFDLDLADARCILLVRDPRDMLVSLYYSVMKSHRVPAGHRKFESHRRSAQEATIDEFVIRNHGTYLRSLKVYQDKLANAELMTCRYEDVIYEKAKWLRQMIDFLGLPWQRRFASLVVRRNDVFPDAENQDAHIRQVHPGNYLNKLQAETIQQLNERLAPFLTHYGYA